MAKALRVDAKGYFFRNLGYEIRRNGRRSQPKFILGKDRVLAEERLRRIEQVWNIIVKDHEENTDRPPTWNEPALEIARAVARGDTTFPVPLNDLEPAAYSAMVQAMSAMWPVITFVPEEPFVYVHGLDVIGAKGETLMEKAEQIQEYAHKIHAEASAHVVVSGRKSKPLKPIGGTLHKAMNKYISWIEKEYFDSSEKHVSDNGKTKIRQVRTLMHHLPDVPLSKLNAGQCDELFAVFRRRPKSRRHDKPMARKSCANYIGELGRFFDWLDRSNDYEWELPPKFYRIKRTPNELDSDIDKEAADIPVYTLGQLTTLYRYATPIERFFFLLGLNCAFGADQSGRLRVGEVCLSDGGEPSFLTHLRRKKKVRGSHLLWKPTILMLRWMRNRHSAPSPDDTLAVHQNGKPFFGKTRGGNRQNDIAKLWYRLLDRVRADHADFPRHGFNILRDTSTDMVRQAAGEELAKLHCSHKHQSIDTNLASYSRPRRIPLHDVHMEMEKALAPVFIAVDDPTKPNPQAYTSLGTIAKIRALHDDGFAAAEISTIVGVHTTTVYRHVK
jgi:hypothetical protein